jgi:aminopeptidase N
MGVEDAVADRPSDEFDSSTQYGAVVYGKAPGLYRALEARYGVDETTDALAAVVADHAFDQVAPDDLRAGLGEALGDPAGVDSLWNRWLEERHGDEDLPG